MLPTRSTLRITPILLFLLLTAAAAAAAGGGGDDELDELFAIDEEEEQLQHKSGAAVSTPGKPSEAEVLSRAQRFVLELSNENAKQVIDGNELVLVLGYAPWCPRSAELMPRFAEAATTLREMGNPLVMAKLDAERHAKAASFLGIKGFPTILLFVNGTAQAYTGGFTGEEIVIWARKRTGIPVIRPLSVAEAEEFVKKHHIFVIGFFDKFEGPEYDEFVKAATVENEVQFVEANDINIAKVLFPDIGPERHFLGLVKSEPERFENFDEKFDAEKILKFVEYNKFLLVTSLSELNSGRVYSSPVKLQVFVFAEADEFEQLLPTLQDVARIYKTKIMFVYVDSADDNLAKPLLALFGIESEKPVVTAFDNGVGSKYLLELDPTLKNLDDFCSGLLLGKLLAHFKSEPKPNEKGMIEKVVGKTFDASILDSTQNVFLEVFTPWCIDCEATSKLVEKLAKHFNGLDNIKFARIDASQNEHPMLEINQYPTLLFYPAADKSNPIKLSKKSSFKDLVAFIKENIKSAEGRGDSSNTYSKNDEL